MNHPIYLALDFPNWEETEHFLTTNNLEGAPVKVGMELFYREGPAIIKKLKRNDHAIFLDLKLHDIPTTVRHALRNIASLGVDLVNVHALGGKEMIMAAKEGLEEGAVNGNVPKLIAVTVLTSMDENVLREDLLIRHELSTTVTHLAKLSQESGADGVVCSVHEVTQIKETCGSDFLTVTPGIRLEKSSHQDQKRVATPTYAREIGTDAIVIGRSVTKSQDPKEAYQQAEKEWNHVS
ncbi:orotidine-5'-phosphate decarboxylase [Aquibacillus sp. 3ASR75-11]|uniref:Orotidine 5'-phosphate decarboxylase n=1 Tax=Terrihalobacillus insolitus TaxID=2950438 RepID=A0A9X3WS48_9BACI|nr:orotidine-5'-phosphate decarboxylase [Terrihalobacillus insolitus]MDC3412861.1 orotidine-5'-phosphate decarboxylase [Terrihalobacillus insolitus]MDC3423663.1 orotidine-5'-phosphate decarboxylase [Terrihalobacillus insolitus]